MRERQQPDRVHLRPQDRRPVVRHLLDIIRHHLVTARPVTRRQRATFHLPRGQLE